MLSKIKEIYDYREMIVSMIRRDLRGRYKCICFGIFMDVFESVVSVVYIYNGFLDNYES